MSTCLLQSNFLLDNGPTFAGYYDPAQKWNGWACPYFTWLESRRIATWINSISSRPILMVNEDKKVIISLEDPDSLFEIDGQMFLTSEGETLLYAVGTGGWMWTEVYF